MKRPLTILITLAVSIPAYAQYATNPPTPVTESVAIGTEKPQPPPARPNAAPAKPATVNRPISLAVSLKTKILVVRLGGKDIKTYTVAVGSKGHQTPQGHYSIRRIVWNPAWVPPKEGWAKGKKATPPGHPKNPMKVVKIFFKEPDIYIHGTDDEDSLGDAASHGCIRMSESEVATLARYLMEHGGAPQSEGWFEAVIGGGKTADIHLPKSIPIVLGP